MKENNLIKILIPLIAVVVVFESIVLVTSLNKGTKTDTTDNQSTSSAVTQNVSSEVVPIELVFAADSTEMKVGKTYKVSLNMMGKENHNLDGLDLYVKYDPEMVNVTNLNFPNKKLPQPTFSKVSTLKSVIVTNFLISETSGFVVNKDELVNLISFSVTPKKEGKINFEISTGNENNESVTMFVENSTGKNLTFSSNKLEINTAK